MDGKEVFRPFSVSIGACSDATDDKESREDGWLAFVAPTASTASGSLVACLFSGPSVGEFVKEDEFDAGSSNLM